MILKVPFIDRVYTTFKFVRDKSYGLRIFFLCLLCLFFLCVGKAAIGAYNDIRGFKTAAKLLNNGMYLEALSIYQEISIYSDKQDNRAQALLFMGTVYSLYLDQYNAALKQYDRIMKVYPDSSAAQDALFNSGMVLYESGKFKKAYAHFMQYITKYPDGTRRQSAEVWAESAKDRKTVSRLPADSFKAPPPREIYIPDTTIRVLIINKADKITVSAGEYIEITDSFSGKKIYQGLGPVTFTRYGQYLAANGRSLNVRNCCISSDGATVSIDNRRFRGSIKIYSDSKRLCAINNIQVEDYLYGVVPGEMPHGWAQEALMAQAVAARTYALYIKSKRGDKNYDVESTTASQVYSGFDAEKTASNRAVDLTRNRVITYDGKLIIAYFHARSGGYTEDSKNVWSADLPYLKGISDKFSKNIQESSWDYFLSYNTMRSRLNKYGLNIGAISVLNAEGKSRSGRVMKVRVVSDNGTSILKSNDFRIKVGPTNLKSTLLQVIPHDNGVLFKGKGYGHGVGMSQWGANRMAQTGFGYQDILKHYYHNVQIVSIKS